MEGFYVRRADDRNSPGTTKGLTLLAKHDSVEIMTQRVDKNATVWLSPGTGENDFEYFFVHEGEMQIDMDGETITFRAGDSFFINRLKNNVLMRCTQSALLLYVSTCPVFSSEAYWQEELRGMLRRINEKDHYTRRHSRAVMRYAVRLYEELKEYCPGLTLEDYVLGALFHDVGKCNVPGEILRKKDRLTNDEYRVIMHHPVDSARILEPIYGERIAELARTHHERMDGSGYPCGLMGEEIPFEARILAVADVFDAMTSDRGYNKVKTFEEAAQELYMLDRVFDRRVTETLLNLVRAGEITVVEDEDDE